MNRWKHLTTLALVAGALAGCGGGDGGSKPDGAQSEAVTPVSEMKPGEKFSMETPLEVEGSQVSHYVVYGVTPTGALVDSSQPGLLDGVRVSILESVQRNGGDSAVQGSSGSGASTFVDPASLRRKQVEFYQQLWNAMAEHEGTRDPQAILAEIDDLDGRIVDLMDDVGASGVTLQQYLDFYDRMDEMPAFASKQLPELNLREALAAQDNASVFDETPPACGPGLTRVVSQSGLYSYCRTGTAQVKAQAKVSTLASSSVLSEKGEPSIAGILKSSLSNEDLMALMLRVQQERSGLLEQQLKAEMEAVQAKNARAQDLQQALSQNGQNDQLWRDFCAQKANVDMDCTGKDAAGFGVVMVNRVKTMIDSSGNSQQMDMLRLQNLSAKRNEAFEQMTALIKKMQDVRSSIIGNMR